MLLDIWGQHFKTYKITKLIHYRRIMKQQVGWRKWFYRQNFVYSLRSRINFRRKKRLKKDYIKPKILYNYYLTLRRKTYRHYLYRAKKKVGYFYRNYLTLVEGRLFMLVYRSNFVSNLFRLKFIIAEGYFLVNGIERYSSNFNVKVGEIIQVKFKYKIFIYYDMLFRIRKGISNWLPRNYLFINYKFLFSFFLREPKPSDFQSYPISLDPYIGSDIYFL